MADGLSLCFIDSNFQVDEDRFVLQFVRRELILSASAFPRFERQPIQTDNQ